MDFLISFFRDFLDGPLYIVIAVICGVLICSCIGYLGEQYLMKQEAKKLYNETHADVFGKNIDTLYPSDESNQKQVANVAIQQSVEVAASDSTKVG